MSEKIHENQDRKSEINMTIYATRKASPYIVKKECAAKIVNSKKSPESADKVRNRAQAFRVNNLQGKKG